MKGGLEVIIKADSFVLISERGNMIEEISRDEADAGESLLSFCKKHGLRTGTVNLFLAEELVYVTKLDIPAGTPNLGEALRFQLGVLAPFPEHDILYSYTADRDGDNYRVTLAAARSGQVISLVEQLVRSGFVVKGLYPESQRYVTGKWRKLKWALVLPGKLSKIFVFEGGRLSERFLSREDNLQYDELTRICDTANIFHPDPPEGEGFRAAQMLLAAQPMLKDHNMLPPSYRRLDYLKLIIISLTVMNLVGLVALGGVKFMAQARIIDKADREIARLEPLVREVKETRKRIRQTESFIELVGELKGNPQLFSFLENLTLTLPEDSYLNQLQVNVPEGTAVINGFTGDVAGLTEKLQSVGETRLQSTSRRRDMTYFQVEISLP